MGSNVHVPREIGSENFEDSESRALLWSQLNVASELMVIPPVHRREEDMSPAGWSIAVSSKALIFKHLPTFKGIDVS